MNPRFAAVLGIGGPCLLAVALGACSRETTLLCGRDTLYLEAQTVGRLSVPDDLTVPNESESLRVPDLPLAIERGADESGGCLEHSPAFSAEE